MNEIITFLELAFHIFFIIGGIIVLIKPLFD